MKTLYYNGKIYSGKEFIEAFLEEDGKFLKVGTYEELKKDADQEVDLEGKTVTPGMIDSHMHVLYYGTALAEVQLAGTKSIKEVQERIREYIEREKPEKGTWVKGSGWNQDYFEEKRFPTKEDLDQVSTEYPIFIIRACYHIACANSKALEVAGITEETQSPEGGEIEKDENGKLTGMIKENAQNLINAVIPKPTKEDIKNMIEKAAQSLNSYGVTSSHTDDLTSVDAPYETIIQAYKELEQEGKLTVRIYEQSQLKTPELLQEFLDAGYNTGVGTDLFKIGPLKILGDGSLGARTAYLQAPYSDAPDKIGIPVHSEESLQALIKLAHDNNMSVAVHAIGDQILKNIIDAIEMAQKANPKENMRHGIVHCQIMDKPLLDRFVKNNLLAYIQTIFIDYDINIVYERLGKERAEQSYRFKTFKDSGLNISNGSDCPVELPNPMTGIQCAVTRQNLAQTKEKYLPDEALTIEEAIQSYTVNGAYASFEENTKGQIKEGMISDFVIWDKDIFTVPEKDIQYIRPYRTYLGGKVVYQA